MADQEEDQYHVHQQERKARQKKQMQAGMVVGIAALACSPLIYDKVTDTTFANAVDSGIYEDIIGAASYLNNEERGNFLTHHLETNGEIEPNLLADITSLGIDSDSVNAIFENLASQGQLSELQNLIELFTVSERTVDQALISAAANNQTEMLRFLSEGAFDVRQVISGSNKGRTSATRLVSYAPSQETLLQALSQANKTNAMEAFSYLATQTLLSDHPVTTRLILDRMKAMDEQIYGVFAQQDETSQSLLLESVTLFAIQNGALDLIEHLRDVYAVEDGMIGQLIGTEAKRQGMQILGQFSERIELSQDIIDQAFLTSIVSPNIEFNDIRDVIERYAPSSEAVDEAFFTLMQDGITDKAFPLLNLGVSSDIKARAYVEIPDVRWAFDEIDLLSHSGVADQAFRLAAENSNVELMIHIDENVALDDSLITETVINVFSRAAGYANVQQMARITEHFNVPEEQKVEALRDVFTELAQLETLTLFVEAAEQFDLDPSFENTVANRLFVNASDLQDTTSMAALASTFSITAANLNNAVDSLILSGRLEEARTLRQIETANPRP